MGMSQDKLGEKIGLDLPVASTRISRYESGSHQPAVNTARDLANALGVPLGYLYCDDDRLANIIMLAGSLPSEAQEELLQALKKRAQELGRNPPEEQICRRAMKWLCVATVRAENDFSALRPGTFAAGQPSQPPWLLS